MNSIQLMLQQQLLLQQLIICNKLMATQYQMVPEQAPTPIHTVSPLIKIEEQSLEPLAPTVVPPKMGLLKGKIDSKKEKKIKKEKKSQKEKEDEDSQTNNKPSEMPKKKIFLSMLDIKNAQYKKYKVIEEQKVKINEQEQEK